jgi:S-(hydroxymethyl)glutathione synthase
VLIHVPTLARDSEVGGRPDRWVFTESKHPLLIIPADDLPRYPGWEPAPAAS